MEAICFGFRFPPPPPLSLSFSFPFSTLLRETELESFSTVGSGDCGACGYLSISPLLPLCLCGSTGSLLLDPCCYRRAKSCKASTPPLSHRAFCCFGSSKSAVSPSVSLFVLLSPKRLCLFYLMQFVSSLVLWYKPKNDICLPSGRSAGNDALRLSSCVSRVYENLWRWNLLSVCLCLCVCVGVCLDVKEDMRRERHCVRSCFSWDRVSECTYCMCVYASFNSSLTRGVWMRVWYDESLLWSAPKGGCGRLAVVKWSCTSSLGTLSSTHTRTGNQASGT